jgi:hypothetical protein
MFWQHRCTQAPPHHVANNDSRAGSWSLGRRSCNCRPPLLGDSDVQVMAAVTRGAPHPLLVKVYDELGFGPIQSSGNNLRGGLLTTRTSASAGPRRWRDGVEELGLRFGQLRYSSDSNIDTAPNWFCGFHLKPIKPIKNQYKIQIGENFELNR